jgi:hypothetical protein
MRIGDPPIRAYRHLLSAFGASLVAALAVGAAAAPTPAQGPAAPVNDNYFSSLGLNRPGKHLNSTDTLIDRRDTSGATTQTDIFSPSSHGGPAEVTTCKGTSYGKTIWYDFYPDLNGIVRIRTSGLFDSVVSVMPFNTKTLLPNYGARQCVVNLVTMSQELLATVKAHVAYTIQLGGVNGAGGNLEFQFDFVPTITRLQAQATLSASPTATGVQLIGLTVTAPHGARVQLRCSTGCGHEGRIARTVSFPDLRGRRLPAGARIEILVTKPQAIGAYIRYTIQRGNFTKTELCLRPGSLTPRHSC